MARDDIKVTIKMDCSKLLEAIDFAIEAIQNVRLKLEEAIKGIEIGC